MPAPPSSPLQSSISVVEQKVKIPDEPMDFHLLRHPVSPTPSFIPDHPPFRQEELLSKSENAGTEGNCSGASRSACRILCTTSKLRGVGLVCRSDPSVAYFLPIKASALLLVSRWRIGDFVRAYVIAGALRTRITVIVGRQSYTDSGRIHTPVDGF